MPPAASSAPNSSNKADAAPAGLQSVRSTAVPTSRWAVFLGLALGGCAVDLLTKSWAFERLGMPLSGGLIRVFGDVLTLETSLNEGALFGIGQGQGTLFAALSVIAGGFILYWLFYARAAGDLVLTVALGSVSAGILGNLYDRLGFPGLTWNFPSHRIGEPVFAVRDWIHFEIQGVIDWPVFNVADMMLVGGAFLLVFRALFDGSPAEPNAETANPQP